MRHADSPWNGPSPLRSAHGSLFLGLGACPAVRRAFAICVLLGLGTLLSPAALAHGGHGGFAKSATAGDILVTLELSGAPLLVAGSELHLGFSLEVVSGGPASAVEDVRVRFEGPGGRVLSPEAEKETVGYFLVNVTFPERGSWNVTVTLLPRGSEASFDVDVHGASGYVIESENALKGALDVHLVNETLELGLIVTDWKTGFPAPYASDAVARVSRWTNDHATKLDERIVPLEATGNGRFVLREPFRAPGMHHVFVRSATLGLDFDDRPWIDVLAVTEEEAPAYGLRVPRESPLGPLLGLLAALAVAASALPRRAGGSARGR